MHTHDEAISEDDVLSGANRRGLLRAAAGGLALAASGLLLPVWLAEEAEAREGALGGAKGGRRGKNHRGRHKQRTHGGNKDKGHNDAPRGGAPLGLRSSALTVVNLLVFAVVLALPVLAIPALLRGSVDRTLLETAVVGLVVFVVACALGALLLTTCPSGCCASATGSCRRSVRAGSVRWSQRSGAGRSTT